MRTRYVLSGLFLSVALATTADAQVNMRERIRELFSFGSCGKPLCLDNSVNATNGHGNHFLPDIIASNGAILGFLGDAIATNASSVPLSATSSGATFKFVGGLPVKTSSSLGPVFGERAQTLGKGRFVVGASMTRLNFESFRGVPMDNLILNFTHEDTPPAGLGRPIRENDILQVKLDMNVSMMVTTTFATWGITDAVDIGVAVPIVHTGLTGRSTGQFYPFGIPTSHFFAGDSANPVLSAKAATFGFNTGLGDVAVRMKGTVYSKDRTGVAFMLDGRLPTGSEEALTGSGHLDVRGLVLASTSFGDFSPHVNLGYWARSGEGRGDAVLATTGFDQPLSEWATLAMDVISEWQVGESELKLPSDVIIQYPVTRMVSPTNIPNIRDDRMNGSFGMKFRAPGNLILLANVMVPLRRGGLESRTTYTLGIDSSF